MTLKNLIDCLRPETNIAIRDCVVYLCTAPAISCVLKPYYDHEVAFINICTYNEDDNLAADLMVFLGEASDDKLLNYIDQYRFDSFGECLDNKLLDKDLR